MARDAEQILRAHVVERHFREACRGLPPDGSPNYAEPRMSMAQWVRSCQMVAGVEPEVLNMLQAYWCRPNDVTWNCVATVDAFGANQWTLTEQVARGLTLAQAAAAVGLNWGFREARAAKCRAVDAVAEVLLEWGGGRTGGGT